MRRVLAFCLLLTLVLAGCTTAKPAEAPKSQTLKVLVMGGSGLETTLFTAFEKANGKIKPESVQLPAGSFEEIIASIQSGATKVDAIVGPGNNFLFSKGVIAPLDDMVKKAELSLTEFGTSLEMARYQEKLYGLPLSVSPMVVVYNKEMFEKAGIPLPGANWTWEQFEAAAVALAKVQAEKPKSWGAAISPWSMVDLLLTAGKGPADPDLTALKDMLARLARLQAGTKVVPTDVLGNNETDYYLAFSREEVGMLLGYWENSFAHTKPKFTYKVAPLPGGGPTPGVATLAMITANAENRANAEAFVQFVGSLNGSMTMVSMPGSPVPAYVTDMVKAQWMAHTGLGQDSTFLMNLKYLPWLDYPAQMAAPLLTEADAAIKGKKTVDEAIAAYQQARAPFMSKK